MPDMILTYFPWLLFAVCLALIALLVVKLISTTSPPPGTAMAGMWRLSGLPGYQGARRT